MYRFCVKLFTVVIFGSCIAKASEEEVAPIARRLFAVAEEDSAGPAGAAAGASGGIREDTVASVTSRPSSCIRFTFDTEASFNAFKKLGELVIDITFSGMENPTLPLKLDKGKIVSREGAVTPIPYYKATSLLEEGWEEGKPFDLCSLKTKIDPRYTILAVESLEISRTCGDGITTQPLCRYNINGNPLVFPISELHKDLNQTAFLLIRLSRKRQPKNDKPYKGWNFNFSLRNNLTGDILMPIKPSLVGEFIPISASERRMFITSQGAFDLRPPKEDLKNARNILKKKIRTIISGKKSTRLGLPWPSSDHSELGLVDIEDARRLFGDEIVDQVIDSTKK
ncbi:MAG: hypothetical protein FJX18_05635 [Alphaproteobacteria bacterium]|nr:hypothetical protein [Alphaproteobacteria bacterium]